MTEKEISKILMKFKPKKLLPDHIQGMRFVCGYLAKYGKTSVKVLGDALGVSSARMAVIINKLEEKGYVVRTKSEDDKRITNVEITKEGLYEMEKGKKQVFECFKRIEAALGENEFERFMQDLDVISSIDMEDLEC